MVLCCAVAAWGYDRLDAWAIKPPRLVTLSDGKRYVYWTRDEPFEYGRGPINLARRVRERLKERKEEKQSGRRLYYRVGEEIYEEEEGKKCEL